MFLYLTEQVSNLTFSHISDCAQTILYLNQLICDSDYFGLNHLRNHISILIELL